MLSCTCAWQVWAGDLLASVSTFTKSSEHPCTSAFCFSLFFCPLTVLFSMFFPPFILIFFCFSFPLEKKCSSFSVFLVFLFSFRCCQVMFLALCIGNSNTNTCWGLEVYVSILHVWTISHCDAWFLVKVSHHPSRPLLQTLAIKTCVKIHDHPAIPFAIIVSLFFNDVCLQNPQTLCFIFSTFEIPAIIKSMVEKGSLCFVASEGSIQKCNMILQAMPTLQKGSYSWRTKLFTEEYIVPKHVWLCGKSLSRFCHLWIFNSKAYQTVPIWQ